MVNSIVMKAGRYIADFRKYSEKYPFRQRSETPEIAIELSLQPWRKFGVDGVIMFSGEQIQAHLTSTYQCLETVHKTADPHLLIQYT
jgi:uroporphyrinogen-III decarboxylase